MAESGLFNTTALGRCLQDEQETLQQMSRREQNKRDYTYVLMVSSDSYHINKVSCDIYITASKSDSIQKLRTKHVQRLISRAVDKLHSEIRSLDCTKYKIHPKNVYLSFECNANIDDMQSGDMHVRVLKNGSIKFQGHKSRESLDRISPTKTKLTFSKPYKPNKHGNSTKNNATSDDVEITFDAGDQSVETLDNMSSTTSGINTLYEHYHSTPKITAAREASRLRRAAASQNLRNMDLPKYQFQPLTSLIKHRARSPQRHFTSKSPHHMRSSERHHSYIDSEQNENESAHRTADAVAQTSFLSEDIHFQQSYCCTPAEEDSHSDFHKSHHSRTNNTEVKATQTLSMMAGPYAVSREPKWTDDFNQKRHELNKLIFPKANSPQNTTNHNKCAAAGYSTKNTKNSANYQTFASSPSQQRIAAAKPTSPSRSIMFSHYRHNMPHNKHSNSIGRSFVELHHDERNKCNHSSQAGSRGQLSQCRNKTQSETAKDDQHASTQPPQVYTRPPCISYSSSEFLERETKSPKSVPVPPPRYTNSEKVPSLCNGASDDEWEDVEEHNDAHVRYPVNKGVHRLQSSYHGTKCSPRSTKSHVHCVHESYHASPQMCYEIKQATRLQRADGTRSMAHKENPKSQKKNLLNRVSSYKTYKNETNTEASYDSYSTDMCVNANISSNTGSEDAFSSTDGVVALDSKIYSRRTHIQDTDDTE